METFAPTKPLVDSLDFQSRKRLALKDLGTATIDAPIQHIINGFSKLTCCYTLQCCYGHFVYAEQPDRNNIEPLPAHDIGNVTYRIAYIAFCIENSQRGKTLLSRLSRVPLIEPEFIQFGSPDWFWDRQPNSYALQVEPARFMGQDQAVIDYLEALHVQDVRKQFFTELEELVQSLVNEILIG